MTDKIKHVFVLMLENHSFDNIFAMSGIEGITAATTEHSNIHNGIVYPVKKGAPPTMSSDPGHEFPDVVEQLAGAGVQYQAGTVYPPINNAGFAYNYATTTTELPKGVPLPTPEQVGDIMACFDTPTQLPVLYQLATEFAICDHWFSSVPGPTLPNRFFLHGASSAGLDHSPTTKQQLEWFSIDGFEYPNGSIYDALNTAGRPWRLYHDKTGLFSDNQEDGSKLGGIAFVSTIKGIHSLSLKDVLHLPEDLKGDYPYFYTFIEPNYGDLTGKFQGGSSQHPMDDTYGCEALVKFIYEAIRNSPLWDSSLFIITYDEHGGFYDSVAPSTAVAPNDNSPTTYNQYGFTFEQLGVRVPAIVVSPWIAKNTVDKTVYDHTSVLATLEKLADLPPLTQRDANAHDVLHLCSLDTARSDCPTTLNKPVNVHRAKAATHSNGHGNILDKPGNISAFMLAALKTEFELSPQTDADREAILQRFQEMENYTDAKDYLHNIVSAAHQHHLQRRAALKKIGQSWLTCLRSWLSKLGFTA
ncbi:MAG: alkaline phosphatase family protein [Methylococcaceae bacterium]